jgi:hypothetical protein
MRRPVNRKVAPHALEHGAPLIGAGKLERPETAHGIGPNLNP